MDQKICFWAQGVKQKNSLPQNLQPLKLTLLSRLCSRVFSSCGKKSRPVFFSISSTDTAKACKDPEAPALESTKPNI